MELSDLNILICIEVLSILCVMEQIFCDKPPEGSNMTLQKTGAVLCKGGFVQRGAPVDPECSANIGPQLATFANVKFQTYKCTNGSCVAEYTEKGILAYVCEAWSVDNAHVEGHCKITAPANAGIIFSPESTNATFKVFRRDDDCYY